MFNVVKLARSVTPRLYGLPKIHIDGMPVKVLNASKRSSIAEHMVITQYVHKVIISIYLKLLKLVVLFSTWLN